MSTVDDIRAAIPVNETGDDYHTRDDLFAILRHRFAAATYPDSLIWAVILADWPIGDVQMKTQAIEFYPGWSTKQVVEFCNENSVRLVQVLPKDSGYCDVIVESSADCPCPCPSAEGEGQ